MEGESGEKEIHRKTSWKKGGERVRGKEREKGGHGGRWDGRDPIEAQREENLRWFCVGGKESEGEGESRRGREGGGETRRNRHGEEGKLTERRMSRCERRRERVRDRGGSMHATDLENPSAFFSVRLIRPGIFPSVDLAQPLQREFK